MSEDTTWTVEITGIPDREVAEQAADNLEGLTHLPYHPRIRVRVLRVTEEAGSAHEAVDDALDGKP
jgi:hypothetical protein